MSNGEKRPAVSFCELRVNGPHCATDWTLRQLEGKWLIESATSIGHGAAFRDNLGQAVGFAIDRHESYGDPRDD